MSHNLSDFFSFRHAHMRSFLISVLLPIMALFVILSGYYMEQSLKHRRISDSDVMDTAASVISANFAELEQTSFTPYLYSDVSQAMIYIRNGFMHPEAVPKDYLKTAELENSYTNLFTKMLHTSTQKVLSITFYPFGDEYGTSYSITRNSSGLQYAQVDETLVETMYRFTSAHQTLPVFLHLEDAGEETYSLLRIIRDMDVQKDLGILRIDTSTAALRGCMENVSVTPNSCLVLIDGQGHTIHSIGSAELDLIDSAQTQMGYIRFNLKLYETHALDIQDWKLVHVCSVSDLLTSFSSSFLIILLIVILAFAATYMLYRRQSADTIESIEGILEAIGQLQKGNRNHVCKVAPGSDEYQIIADALNETGQKLQQLIVAEAEARDSQSRAEFQALQAQINPHFLYNTLNGFIALNRMGERQQLETSIFQLTKLFRHICSSNDSVTVEQEYSFASQYLELQKLRFDERITYRIEHNDDTCHIMIPKLVIQPLVENCVVHGMEAGDQCIEICLRSYLDPGKNRLILEVTDTGVGFDTGILKDSPRVGLKNVITRLKMYHPESDYEIISTPSVGTTVRLLLPIAGKGDNYENTSR